MLYQALAGKGEDLSEVVVVAPERSEVGSLTAHERKDRKLDALAHQTNLGQGTLGPEDGSRQPQRLRRARTVQHRVDRPPTGQVFEFVLHVLGRLAADVDGVMCTVLACDGQFVVAAGESDDGRAGAEQPGVLHGVTTEPTGQCGKYYLPSQRKK